VTKFGDQMTREGISPRFYWGISHEIEEDLHGMGIASKVAVGAILRSPANPQGVFE
jgi:hypothetical protein